MAAGELKVTVEGLAEVIADIHGITAQLTRMENMVATITEQLAAARADINTVNTQIEDVQRDFRALVAQLEAARNDPTVDIQAELDALNNSIGSLGTRVTEFDTEVGDADGSDTPPPAPEEPAPVE